MPDLSAVIFDVDGVLVDSYDAHLESWRAVAREHGVRFTQDDFARTFGRTSRDIIREFWFETSHDDATVQAIDDRKEAIYREIVRENFPAMDGAVDLIDALCQAGIRIAAGSSGPPDNVMLALEHLDRAAIFDVVVTGTDVSRGKPAPDIFLAAAERLGVEPDQCVVIEDAPAGIKAAHQAGMPAVGLVSTGRTNKELAAADLVVVTLHELDVAILRALTVNGA